MEESHLSESHGQHGPVRRRLGRGLNALLGGHPRDDHPHSDDHDHTHTHTREHDPLVEFAPESGSDGTLIAVDLIERNPYQPRKDFAEDALVELVESIRQHGVLQPLLVRAAEGRFQLIAGERRLLAARRVGLESVPCRLMQLDDRHVFEVAIEENLKRKDLNVLEKAQAFQEYLTQFGSTLEELAQRLSMNRSTLSNYLRLLELSDEVKQSLSADRITNGHARALLSLSAEEQAALCRRIEGETLSVRQTEQEVRNILRGESTPTIPFPASAERPSAPAASNHVLSLQDQLRQQLGAKIEIKLTAKEKGRIIIRFDSNEEFEHVVRQLGRAA